MQLKIDFHVHSHYSSDSLITPQSLEYYAKRQGLDAVAVTDHDRLDGAREIAKKVGILIIPGVEVSSSQGHVIGLAVEETVPSGLSVEETVDKIHEAGGVAVACHPASLFKGSVGDRSNARFDAVEVVNSSAFPFNRSIVVGERLASRLRAAKVGGSDAHYGPEIGYAYTILDARLETEEIIKAIREHKCRAEGRAIPLSFRIKRKVLATFTKQRAIM